MQRFTGSWGLTDGGENLALTSSASRNCSQHSDHVAMFWSDCIGIPLFWFWSSALIDYRDILLMCHSIRERERDVAHGQQQSQQHTVEGSTPHLSHILNLFSFLVWSYIFISTLQKQEWTALPPAGLRDHYSTWIWAHQRVAVSSSISVESSVSLTW